MKLHENYTPGYTANASAFMAKRTAQSHAAFLLPHLKPGMRVLDCGCGPGSISLGLARQVAPGEVTGMDRETSQVELARQDAAEKAVANVQFQTGSIYEIPFPDSSFDVVFAHAIFEHLREPIVALKEVRRVLHPEGRVALRSPDWGGFLISPLSADLAEAINFYQQLQTRLGGDVQVGRKFKQLLRAAGFTDLAFSATYECYAEPEFIGEYLAQRIEKSAVADRAVELGWTTDDQIIRMTAALREWCKNPDAVFAQAWCEIIGSR